METSPVAAGFLDRLAAVEHHLVELAARTPEIPADARTAPDGATGEVWEAGQVWAHTAEFPAFWVAQARHVLTAVPGGPPVPFGRVKSDPDRIAAIEGGRRRSVDELLADVRSGIAEVRAFLLEGPVERWETARGVHSTLGEMDLERIVEEFMVGHLEEHADQLESLLR